MRRTTKSSLAASLAACLAGALLIVSSIPVRAQQKSKAEPYAIVGGTVFLDSGMSQPGAKVVIVAKDQPGKKLGEQTSSPRGEFSFRVPPGPKTYIISATLKGFEPVSKEVDIEAQEQVHKTLLLVPASK